MNVLLRVGFALGVAGFVASGCVRLHGNGVLVHEARLLVGFVQVVNQSSIEVRVTQGMTESVVVTADANLVPLITTQVFGGVLTIGERQSFRTTARSYVDVTLTSFSGAELRGSGAMSVQVAQAGSVSLHNGGSGALRFAGQVGAVSIDLAGSGATSLAGSAASLDGSLSGSGTLNGSGFFVGESTFSLSGSGSARLMVQGNATLSVAGSGTIDATLNGGVANASVSGSGNINWSGTSMPGMSAVSGSGRINHL